MLKEVGELISLTLSQAQNHQPLSGSTIFNRIEIPTSFDPLNGDFLVFLSFHYYEVLIIGCWQYCVCVVVTK